jgi:PAS domain S-box-containing protein
MPTSSPESPRPTGPASGPAPRGMSQASSDGDNAPGDLAHPIGPSFRHFAESLPDLVWSARPDGFCDYFNRRFLAYLGTTLDEMRAVEWAETLHPDDVGRCCRAWEDAYTTGGEYEVEYRIRRHDGVYRWHRGHATPMRDDSGRIARWFGTCTDIDDRKRAEERERLLSAEAATANARFRAFFEQGALFAGIMAVDGTIIEPNRLSLEGCGYTREEVVGRPFWECPWWSRSESLVERIKSASARAAAGETFRAEMPYFVADGSERIVDLSLLPIRDEAGRVVFLAPTGTDITDRKRAEEEARLSHARFEAVLDAAPIGVYVVDADLRIRQVNPKARPVFGDIEGLIGRDFVEVIHILWTRAYAAEVVGRFRHTLETGEPCFVPERIEERLDRRVLEYYEWQVHRISLPGGRYGVVCYFSDVSRHVLARQALAEADRRKDEFLAMLAHELRNPLAPIRTGLEILRHAEGDDRPIEPLRAMMERQVDHLTRLVDDLMDVSRITRGKIELRKEVVDLGTILGHVVEAARPSFVERRHELIVGWPEGPIHLEADPTRLGQILDNLLNNACKYTEPGGCIRLTAGREGGSLVLRVRDTGIGIAPEKLPYIFDLFMQAERRLDRSQGGLGIGLSLVRSLAEMHGGEVTARSDGPGRGSEFVVRLPALPPTSVTGDRAEPGAGLEPAPSLPRRRILVVDDNPDSARTMAMLLRRSWGQEVEVAHDGPGAIEVALTFRPELLLLDLGLPGMSGYEVARHLRQRPEFAGTLIVAMTGWGQDSDRQRSAQAGFDHHLVKPVDPEALRSLLAALRGKPGLA